MENRAVKIFNRYNLLRVPCYLQFKMTRCTDSRTTAPSRKNLGDFSSYPAGLVHIRYDTHYKRGGLQLSRELTIFSQVRSDRAKFTSSSHPELLSTCFVAFIQISCLYSKKKLHYRNCKQKNCFPKISLLPFSTARTKTTICKFTSGNFFNNV